jgi:ribosomal-protein-alanine N-acetyltransferase
MSKSFDPSDRQGLEPITIALDHAALALTTDWRTALPVMKANGVTIRELRISDAPSLSAHLTTAEVARFISTPPADVAGFAQFILWMRDRHAAGTHMCFGIVPDGCEHAIGLIQIRAMERAYGVAEWGFAIGSAFWGTGVFSTAARAVLDFMFAIVRVSRVEARACVENSRGNAALARLGAVNESVLRNSFHRNGDSYDQYLWAITAIDWTCEKIVSASQVVH